METLETISDALCQRSCVFSRDAFVSLLTRLMNHVKHLQNDGSHGLVPLESLIVDELIHEFAPFSTLAGGPLQVNRLEYTIGRPNLMVTFSPTSNCMLHKEDCFIAFIGG